MLSLAYLLLCLDRSTELEGTSVFNGLPDRAGHDIEATQMFQRRRSASHEAWNCDGKGCIQCAGN